MKKLMSIGLAIVLLAGCGGSTTTTSPTGVSTDNGGMPTSVPISPGIVTPVTELPTDTVPGADATSMPNTEATAPPAGATNMPSADATSIPSSSPATAIDPATVTQQVSMSDLGLTFNVPAGWEQVAGENAWGASGADLPRIGVTSAPLNTDWRPSSMLPEGATVKSSAVQTIPLGQVTIYTVENSDGTAESHTIIRSAETAYDLYARAVSTDDLQSFQPVLNATLNSIQLSQG